MGDDIRTILIILNVLLICVWIYRYLYSISVHPDQPTHTKEKTVNVPATDIMPQNHSLLSQDNTILEGLLSSPSDSFCDVYSSDPSELRSQAASLTEDNCKSSKCTVWLTQKDGSSGCAVGNQLGPTFLTQDGAKVDVDHYYYMNKCYGNCSSV
jgi:hypothetical protein